MVPAQSVIQVMSTSPTETKIKADVLSKVLRTYGQHSLSIYSINGKFKTGKSFLLNCILKYLLFGQSHPNNWLERDLPGKFACDGGAQKCTQGIDTWHEPILVDTWNGEKVAVILLDTQGLFDDVSNVKDNSNIFTFSAILSSCIIFNVMEGLDERDWQFLEYFMDFAKQALSTDQKQDLRKLIFKLIHS
jgi:atlastin